MDDFASWHRMSRGRLLQQVRRIRRGKPMTTAQREFFPKVRKTVIPRPVVKEGTDVLGQSGAVRASAATLYGTNWHHDHAQDLIEIWDAGAALCFKDVLPRKDKYAREDLYLRLSIAYRSTPNAFANLRTFSGNHVTLPNAPDGAMYDDPFTRYFITDDCTININSIYRDERIWLQRVDWEWVSQETLFEDELASREPYLYRTREEVEALYAKKKIDDDTVKEFLIKKIREDSGFAKRSLLLLCEGSLLRDDLVALYGKINHGSD
jgi:hypothetical protein